MRKEPYRTERSSQWTASRALGSCAVRATQWGSPWPRSRPHTAPTPPCLAGPRWATRWKHSWGWAARRHPTVTGSARPWGRAAPHGAPCLHPGPAPPRARRALQHGARRGPGAVPSRHATTGQRGAALRHHGHAESPVPGLVCACVRVCVRVCARHVRPSPHQRPRDGGRGRNVLAAERSFRGAVFPPEPARNGAAPAHCRRRRQVRPWGAAGPGAALRPAGRRGSGLR